VTEVPEQARRWQQRLDQAFPKGVIVASADPTRQTTFPVPRPEVLRMRGLDPYVFVDSPVHGRNFGGVITGWEPVPGNPVTLVKVTMDTGDRAPLEMLWSGNISPAQATALEPVRQQSLAASARGELYTGDEAE
jgi:hypothetical protein